MQGPTSVDPRERASRLAQVRRDAYRLLGSLFLTPPPGEASGLTALADTLRTTLGEVAPEVVSELTGDLTAREDTAELIDDYRALLEVQTGRSLVPVESVYAAATFDGSSWQLGRLRREPWHRVRQRYLEGGFRVRDDAGVESDHIACQLEFLAHLCEVEAAAWAQGRDADAIDTRSRAGEFLREHPGSWIRRLRQRAADLAQTPLYRLTPLIVERFLAIESAHLKRGA